MDYDHSYNELSVKSVLPHGIKGNISEVRDVRAWYPDEEPLPDGYVTIEAVSLEVGAGSRLVVTEHPEHRLRVYDADFFIRRRCNPNQCKAYRVAGDSMRPFIFDKDWVVVDTSNRTPPGPGVTDERLCTYILRIGEEIMVKMLHRLPDGSLRVSSVNPEPKYAPFIVPAQNMDTVEIWGAYLERSGGRPIKQTSLA
nr:S24 family peptidase [Igneacidithiobacillus copahuensis]